MRTQPFAAHAWVEAEGEAIGEPHPAGYYKPLLTVPPREPTASRAANARTGRAS